MPATLDFEMVQGDTKTIEVTVEDPTGTVVDLTGAVSIRWKMAKSVTATVTLAKSVGSGISVVDAEEGRFDIALATGDTESLSGGFYHEAEVIDSLNRVATVLTGTITIAKALIKPA
jgi:hypothetical protein